MVTLVPWCACMGATFPFAMRAVQQQTSQDGARSFSYLYLANVLGAMVGTWAPLFLIELVGFRATLRYAGVLNLALGICAWTLSSSHPSPEEASVELKANSTPGWGSPKAIAAFRHRPNQHGHGSPVDQDLHPDFRHSGLHIWHGFSDTTCSPRTSVRSSTANGELALVINLERCGQSWDWPACYPWLPLIRDSICRPPSGFCSESWPSPGFWDSSRLCSWTRLLRAILISQAKPMR